jgi:putative tryptophan/tyrosine transport system substrate-binding protein
VTRFFRVTVIALAAWVSSGWLAEPTHAEQTSSPRRIGVVAPGFSADSEQARAFREGLRTAGYVEGRDVSIDWWFGHGSYEGVADAVAKVVGSKVDVIVVESTVAALAAKRATQTIPIVMALVGDPVGVGLVESLGHPGGNITGLTNMSAELMAKRLQLLKEAVPSARRIGVLWNPDTPFHSIGLAHLKAVAPELHVELVPIAVHKVEQFGPAFSALTRSKVDGVMALDDPFMTNNGIAIVRLATKVHLPLAFGWKPLAAQGILICYQTQESELFGRAAGYVDKILKGASPATLPVEQPTKFELVVNLKTARALGITFPESILLRADEVIR